jgi:hypothetical protein
LADSGEVADPRDSLELSGRAGEGLPTAHSSDAPLGEKSAGAGSGYLRIFFSCSNTYTRAQKTPAGDGYTARCAACGLTKKFVIGPGGTGERAFVLTCK